MAQIEESVARYLEQLDTADRQEPSEALTTKTNRLKEKIETLKEQMRRLELLKVEMLATPDQQISLTDPDARSMATSGRGSGVVGYNVQIAVEANHHLIVMHEVTNDGTDRSQLSHVANETKKALGVEKLDAVADRGYFNSEEILACEEADCLRVPPTSPAQKSEAGKKESTARHLNRRCRRSATPSSTSSCDQVLSDVRTADPGSARKSSVSKSAKVVLAEGLCS